MGFAPEQVIAGEGRVLSGILPAGRYATLTHWGHYDRLIDATATLIGWAKLRGLDWDSTPGPDGEHFVSRFELYPNGPMDTPDPVAEFLDSLDKVEQLDARLVLSGHGRPFTDVGGHVAANRALVSQRLQAVQAVLADGPHTAYEVALGVYGDRFTDVTAAWLLSKTRCWLSHLEHRGLARREGEDPERWA